MPELDAKYFETLLAESRAECHKYKFSRKDEIVTMLQTYSSTLMTKLAGKKKIEQLKKKKGEGEKEELKKYQEDDKRLHKIVLDLQGDISKTVRSALEKKEICLDGDKDLCLNLMKCALLNQAGPKELAQFCKQEDPAIIEELLSSESVMKEMLLSGGAKNGKCGQAHKLYKELINLINADDEESSSCYKRLAMAVALELTEPIKVFGTKDEHVDPKSRFLHFMEAHKKGELDPSFPYFSTWELRMVVDSDAADDQLQWGRDHLKRYRPDIATMDDRKWRYAEEVQTDCARRQPQRTGDAPGYKQCISAGGKCGPRAWYGRFICKAFGTPTWGVKQPGHAAVGRWTPKKWDTVLGGGFPKSVWDGRAGPDFLAEANARAFQHENQDEYFRKIILLECMAEAYNENKTQGEKAGFDPNFFWRSLVNAQLLFWMKQAKPKHFQRGPDDAPCVIQEYKSRTDDPKDDNIVETQDDGTIRIPACAFSKKDNVQLMKCFEGGGQIYLANKTSELEYKIPESVPGKEYDLSCLICNVHHEHENGRFCFAVNDSSFQETSTPYTVGEWKMTPPLRISVGPGDTLILCRKSENNFGITMKEIVLKPL